MPHRVDVLIIYLRDSTETEISFGIGRRMGKKTI